MDKTVAEYTVLRILENNPTWTQREVAKELGLSLGKTNYVIHALIDKGWVKVSNFRRSDNKLRYLYILTPQGITERAILARVFLKTMSQEYNRLKREIEKLKNEL